MTDVLEIDAKTGARKAALERRFHAFAGRHPRRSAAAAGVEWRYLRGGTGGPAILLLPGVLGQADFGFEAIAELERHATVIAADYPPVADLDAVAEGLTAILDAEGLERAHVMGGSFGGVAAQAFAWTRPERVASLILSHTGPPRRVPGQGVALALLKVLPERLLKRMMARRLRPLLAKADPFWSGQFARALAALDKADILNRVALATEFSRRYAGRPAAPAPHPVLILDSDDDPLFLASQRALPSLYPGCAHRRFSGTGHIAAILEPEALASAIREFIAQAEGQAGA